MNIFIGLIIIPLLSYYVFHRLVIRTGTYLALYAFLAIVFIPAVFIFHSYGLEINKNLENFLGALLFLLFLSIIATLHESQKIVDGDENWKERENRIKIKEKVRKDQALYLQKLERQLQKRRLYSRSYTIRKKADL